ncbi:MAG: flgK [Caulobacteraceae bacterium]|nr:flgK [Caulobacteraceae bacterium]
MSLNQIMLTAASGMNVAQTQMRAVSDNIANVNTPGYARKVVDQATLVVAGVGSGVDVASIHSVANAFLQSAARNAQSASAGAGASADLFSRTQSLFGDPSEDSSFFSQLDQLFSSFSAAASDPSSTVLRSGAVDATSDFLDQAGRIAGSIKDLRGEADSQIGQDVQEVNGLLVQIDNLNGDIKRARAGGADSSGSENQQSSLIDQLAKLMDVKVTAKQGGGVVVRTSDGISLAGDGPATVSFSSSSSVSGALGVTPYGASLAQPLPLALNGGEMRGLANMRSRELPAIAQQLSEFVSGAVDALNAGHNASSAVPTPASLTGRNTGLDLPTAVSGFTGKTNIALVNADGTLAHKIAVDFSAGTMTLDGGAASAFTPANFLTQLNSKLGASGSAAFSGGQLSLSASGGAGVAIVDDPTAPSQKAGKGFSAFFGLNDLVASNTYANYDTGLKPTDSNGLLAGGVMTVRVAGANGDRIRDIPISLPAGGTMQNLLDTLNADNSGVGLYGHFGLDTKGAMSFTPNQAGQITFSVISDNSQRGAGGPSVSALFGLGADQRAQRTTSYTVRADILAQPTRMAFGTVNLSASGPVLAAGDGSGALRLADAGGKTRAFASAGDLGAMSTTVTQYGAQLAGLIGRKAAAADTAKTSADAVSEEADAQRASVEGVNLDEELVSLTTYQQSFNASARLIQASKDMYDVLVNMV